METPNEYPTFYVTSKGSVKGPKGGLLLPGDVFPTDYLNDDQLCSLYEGGTITTDLSLAFTVDQPITQPPLQMAKAGSDDEIQPPAKSARGDDAALRQALRNAQAADKDAVEVLGSGPVRRENKEIQPVTETDPSNVTLDSLAGQNISVEQFNDIKR